MGRLESGSLLAHPSAAPRRLNAQYLLKAVLEAAGYCVTWLRQLPLIYTAEVARDDASTRLEWVVDRVVSL